MLTEVVCQAIRDIGSGSKDDSFTAWHRGDLDIYLIAFGVEPVCAREILDGVRLWKRSEVYTRGARIDDRPLRAPRGRGKAGSAVRKRLRSV